MAGAVFPAASAGGGINLVQRGLATGAGNVTITAVDITKAFVNVYGTASSGTIAGSAAVNSVSGTANGQSGTANAQSGTHSAMTLVYGGGPGGGGADTPRSIGASTMSLNGSTFNLNGQSFSLNAQNFSGGSNNLVSAVVQGYLSDSTTLVVSGACRWEVVEFA
jgi:hypothetical protein